MEYCRDGGGGVVGHANTTYIVVYILRVRCINMLIIHQI